MRKTKGYSKGGAKMMKAMKGKMMTKGMRKGGVKTAMGGKMMSKGYAKGGTKMIKANTGIGVNKQKSNASRYNVGKFDKTGKKTGNTIGKFTANDVKVANRMMNAGMITGTAFDKLRKQVKPDFIKGRSELPKKTKPVAKSRLTVAKSRLTPAGKKMLKNLKKKKNN